MGGENSEAPRFAKHDLQRWQGLGPLTAGSRVRNVLLCYRPVCGWDFSVGCVFNDFNVFKVVGGL